jgi:hypothetical protein
MAYEHKSFDLGELGTGLHAFIESADLELTSVGALLDRFNDDIEEHEPMTARPIGKGLNPEIKSPTGMCRAFPYEIWVYVFRRECHVRIIKNDYSVMGPHSARLYYTSWQTGQKFWLASAQIECMFYSEDQMDMRIFDLVYNKRWYVTEKARKDKVAR